MKNLLLPCSFVYYQEQFISASICRTTTAFTRCRQILKTVKNVTAAKFEVAFTRYRNNLKTVGNLDGKNSLQDFDAKELYLHRKKRSVSLQKCLRMFCFHHFQVFTRWRFQNLPIGVPFQNLPFSKPAGKKCAVFV